MTRTEIPRRALQGFDVADKEMLRRTALERNQDPGGGVGNQKHFPRGAKGCHLNGPESRHENIGRREPDTALQARRQIHRRKALTPKMSGQIAGTYEYNLLTLHELKITIDLATNPPLPHPF